MADNVNTSTSLSYDIREYLAKDMLAIARKYLRFENFADKLDFEKGSGKVWRAIRYARVPLPLTSLTEGTTPDGSTITVEQVTGTAEQWGQYITLSDVTELTLAHPVLRVAQERLALSYAETRDREIQRALQSVTNVFYPSTYTARSSITAIDYISTGLIKKAVADLRNGGAEPIDGEYYGGILDPSVEMDIMGDTTFVAAAEYSSIKNLFAGEVGTWMGVRWVRSNFVQKYIGIAAITASAGKSDGSLADGTYYVSVVGRSTTTGFEELISQDKSVTVSGGNGAGKITCTMPSTTGYVYDVYAGSSASAKHLVSSGNSASETVVITELETDTALAPVAPTSGVTVHNVWIVGKGAFGVTDLDAVKRYTTPADASDSDPLQQRRKTGWKAFFKTIILNNDFVAKIECASAY
mgnify:FL=1